jgi:hypothetical protein
MKEYPWYKPGFFSQKNLRARLLFFQKKEKKSLRAAHKLAR